MNTPSLIRPLSAVAAVTALLLAVPFVAMQFTHDVNWSAGDFVAAALLLLTAGTAIVVGVRRAATRRGKALVIAVVVFLLLFVWAHLAVGLFS
jgi:hypothetical protein